MIYLACAWVNKLTRYGYLALLLGIWQLFLSHWMFAILCLGLGVLLLWGSGLGIPTLKAYKIADKRFRRNGGLSPQLTRELWLAGPCVVAGVDLAHRQHLKRVKKACQEPP